MEDIFSDLPMNLLSNFAVEIQDFYKNVLGDKKQKVTDKRKRFMEALRRINTKECPPGSESCYDDSLHRKAYLFRYSPCYTFAVAKHFLGLARQNPAILKDAITERQVNICCLGGGPGTEIVALSKILSLAQDSCEQISEKPLRLRVTIVDENVEWKVTACKVLQTLASSDDIFDQAKMVVRLRFLVADLTKPLTEDVRKALQEADIVTMVALLSALDKTFSRDVPSLTQDITESMKPGGVLFYLDIGKTQQCHTLQKSLESMKDIICVYGPIELEAFTLPLSSLKRNIELFWKTFYGNICLTSTIINSCAWIKTENLNEHQTSLENRKTNAQNTKQWRVQWKRRASLSEEKLKSFNDKVQQILPPR